MNENKLKQELKYEIIEVLDILAKAQTLVDRKNQSEGAITGLERRRDKDIKGCNLDD